MNQKNRKSGYKKCLFLQKKYVLVYQSIAALKSYPSVDKAPTVVKNSASFRPGLPVHQLLKERIWCDIRKVPIGDGWTIFFDM